MVNLNDRESGPHMEIIDKAFSVTVMILARRYKWVRCELQAMNAPSDSPPFVELGFKCFERVLTTLEVFYEFSQVGFCPINRLELNALVAVACRSELPSSIVALDSHGSYVNGGHNVALLDMRQRPPRFDESWSDLDMSWNAQCNFLAFRV